MTSRLGDPQEMIRPTTSIPVPVQVIKDLKGSDYSWSYQTPPSSPSSSSSRKSSMCRSGGGGQARGGPHSSHSSRVTEGLRMWRESTSSAQGCRGPAGQREGSVQEQLHGWGNSPVPGPCSLLHVFSFLNPHTLCWGWGSPHFIEGETET